MLLASRYYLSKKQIVNLKQNKEGLAVFFEERRATASLETLPFCF